MACVVHKQQTAASETQRRRGSLPGAVLILRRACTVVLIITGKRDPPLSTAVPLPLEPLPPADVSAEEQQALRRAVTERLQQHRRRRGQAADVQNAGAQHNLPGMESGLGADRGAGWTPARPNRIADSVAARFAKSPSYRDYLQQEAEAAVRQAEAAAEVARRSAEAVAAAQQQLLDEVAQWDREASAQETRNAAAMAAAAFQAEPAVVLAMPQIVEAEISSVLAPSEALRLPATPVVQETLVPAPAVAAAIPVVEAAPTWAETFKPIVFEPAAEPEPPAEPTTPIPANLIEFPRQLVAARKARPRFAEGPLREDADAERAQLRIFEVEASSFSTTPEVEPATSLPEWSTIHLDSWTPPHELTQPDAQVSFALPVFAAPVERRVMAALVDGCCVGVAFLLAVAAAGLAGGALPTGLIAVGASAVTLMLFGLGYLLLCFTLAGHTVGMRYARIALCTFGDDNPSRSAMRRRLFATGLSAVSLGLGFAWALLDDDGLGWHDRISRIYQRAY